MKRIFSTAFLTLCLLLQNCNNNAEIGRRKQEVLGSIAIMKSIAVDSSYPIVHPRSEEYSSKTPDEAYEVMTSVFSGSPDKELIKPLIETVMQSYNVSITGDNLLKVANMLYSLRKDSKVGVTEMQILKHIYQHGSTSISISEQAGISASLLELNN